MIQIPYLDLGKVNGLHQKEIEEAAMTVVRSGWYLNGNQVGTFRKAWAQYNNAKYCVTTANGLDALTASLISLKILRGWKNGGEVLVSGLTFIASFEAISRVGMTPVPVDVNENDYLMNIRLAEKAITENTVAIVPVNIYGRYTDMRPWRKLADKYHLAIVDDACQMHGRFDISNYCDAVAYSFYPGKNLGALGDAGALITNDKELAEVAEMYCNYGSEKKYHHIIKGVNSRMDELQAAILNVKLKYLDSDNILRRSQARRYNEGINNEYVTLPYEGKDEDKSVWHIYPVFSPYRDELQDYLTGNGVQTLIHYPLPPHKQQAYKELNAHSLPVSERLCQQELSLPLNPALAPQEQQQIIDIINRFKKA